MKNGDILKVTRFEPSRLLEGRVGWATVVDADRGTVNFAPHTLSEFAPGDNWKLSFVLDDWTIADEDEIPPEVLVWLAKRAMR